MTDVAGAAITLLQKPVELVINEWHYLCCFKSYVKRFEDKKEELAAKQRDMKRNIENARGVSIVKNDALQWDKKADELIKVETETKKKWLFGLCPNFWWQYWRGKELAGMTLQMEGLLGRSTSNIVAGPVVSSIQYHSSDDFIPFKSRESDFQSLMDSIKDENCNVIGLQGMGGTGKTFLATKVGVELEKSSIKVIPLVVSNPPDFKKIQRKIARHLDLKLDEEEDEQHSEIIWSKLTNMKERLLIILDDVWEELDLKKDIGIPSSSQLKGCSVLITTRKLNVCDAMKCQRTIQLQMLDNEDALNLFLEHASIHDDDSSSRLKGVAQNIVKQCGGLPVSIVTVARALKNKPLAIWKEALKSLQYSESLFDANGNVRNDYKCLKLSYDYLKNKNAKELFLLCSLFPEDYEISKDALSRAGIGAGLFGEVVKYSSTRSKVLVVIQELVDSCLLLNAEKECVKMHDLVREVALWIANDIQVIIDSKTLTKPNMRCLFWDTDVYPNQFDCRKLEVLLIKKNDGYKGWNVTDALFTGMERLKVLRLDCDLVSSLSLLYSLESLKDIRSITLVRLKLRDVSILGKLSTLETLELIGCRIIKLPEAILELKKLRLLEVRMCYIKMNNPFEVIERCSQLEELYFVDNDVARNEDAVPQNVSCPALERYQISVSEFAREFEEYGSISRFFCPGNLRHIISEAMFKQIVGTAELLTLGKYRERRWKNLIPDIVSVEDGGMNDLIILCLENCPDMRCLIDTRNHYSDIIAFSNLAELHLSNMDVEALYLGSLSHGFLEQLESIKLRRCRKLDGILFNGKLNLRHLKAMELDDCLALTSIFHPFTARSLERLEKVIVCNCRALECIITEQNSGEEIAKENYNSLLPKLKSLEIKGCGKLEMVLPVISSTLEALIIRDCEELKYIFGKYQAEDPALPLFPSLEQINLGGVPSLMGICREYCNPMPASMQRPSSAVSRPRDKSGLCCFLRKRRATSEDTNVAASKERLPASIIPPEIRTRLQTLKNLTVRDIKIEDIFNLTHLNTENSKEETFNREGPKSLTSSLDNLELWNLSELSNICVGPKDILSLSNLSFLNIAACKKLKAVFSASILRSLPKLGQLKISNCEELVRIIEEDYMENNDDPLHHKPCFPELWQLHVECCDKLKYLFSISMFGVLPRLKDMAIKEASNLEHILIRRGEMKEMAMKDVLPKLSSLHLEELPSLVGVCPGVDFPTVQESSVVFIHNCPKFPFYETSTTQLQATGLENLKIQKGEAFFPFQNQAIGYGRSQRERRLGNTTIQN